MANNCETPCIPCCQYGSFPQVKQEEHEKTMAEYCEDHNTNFPEKPEPIDFRPLPQGDPPCYLPQVDDDFPSYKTGASMGPIGPWATGSVNWQPLAGLTGTRPVVNKYSITRFSPAEWRERNKQMFENSYATQDHHNMVLFDSQQCMQKTKAITDKTQSETTKKITQRCTAIHRLKCELERAIEAAIEELQFLKEQHSRLKQAMAILTIPESIVAECLDIRTCRLEPDLVRDDVEEELIKELALTAEIRDIFTKTLNDLNKQIAEESAAKQRLEFDWGDKKDSFEAESLNQTLNNRSSSIGFRAGTTRIPSDQSTAEYWECFTCESLKQAEQIRLKAVALRNTLDAILQNASRDLRTQADIVDTAVAKRCACIEELKSKLEIELRKILRKQVENEKLTDTLSVAIRNMDFPMKVAQSRLGNKIYLPRVENCREISYIGLLDEVKSISNNISALNAQLKQGEETKTKLSLTRGTLEREIMIKLRNLWTDTERIKNIRDHYPSTVALSGH